MWSFGLVVILSGVHSTTNWKFQIPQGDFEGLDVFIDGLFQDGNINLIFRTTPPSSCRNHSYFEPNYPNCDPDYRLTNFMDHAKILFYGFDNERSLIVCNSEDTIAGSQRREYSNFILVFEGMLKPMLEKLKQSPIWTKSTPRSKFLLVTSNGNVTAIFQEMWRNDLVDVHILLLEDQSVFRATPFDDGARCGTRVVPKKTLNVSLRYNVFVEPQGDIAQTSKGIQTSITNTVNIKDENHYEHCTLKAVVQNKIFAFPYVSDPKTDQPGFIIQPLLLLQEIYKLHVEFVIPNKSFQVDILKDEVLAKHLDGRLFDTRVVSTASTPQELDLLEPSETFLVDPNLWVTPKDKPVSTSVLLTRVYKPQVWLATLAVFSATILVLFFVGRIGKIRRLDSFRLALMVWNVSLGNNSHFWPETRFGRWVLAVYLVFTMHICHIYQGKLISTLTKETYEKGFEHFDDILASGIAVAPHLFLYDTVKEFLNETSDPRVKQLFSRMSPTTDDGYERLKKLAQQQNHSTTCMQSYLEAYPNLGREVKVAGGLLLDPISHHYCFRKGHPLFPLVDSLIGKVVEGGLNLKWVRDVGKGDGDDGASGDAGDIVLSLELLEGAFLVLLFGLVVALAVFFGELGRSFIWGTWILRVWRRFGM